MANINLDWFANKLIELMKQKNLNQVELAKILGIKQSQVGNWINGKSLPSHRSLVLLREKLGLSDDEFFSLL